MKENVFKILKAVLILLLVVAFISASYLIEKNINDKNEVDAPYFD